MVKLYFVRHGQASSSWDQSSDPGLSVLGHQQASDVAREIADSLPTARLISSPLRRAQETATPLQDLWKSAPKVEPTIAEIPSTGIPFEDRRAWLTNLMKSDWSEQPDNLIQWRRGILDVLTAQKEDTVFFTHFMVLNVIVGSLTKTEKIVSFRPDNCAITKVELSDRGLELMDKGREAVTVVR